MEVVVTKAVQAYFLALHYIKAKLRSTIIFVKRWLTLHIDLEIVSHSFNYWPEVWLSDKCTGRKSIWSHNFQVSSNSQVMVKKERKKKE